MNIASGKLLQEIVRRICVYNDRERQSIGMLYLEERYKLSRTEILTDRIVDFDPEDLRGFLDRINRYEPVQYILGKTYFYGLPVCVNSSVLIPRPETEELVHLILRDLQGAEMASVPAILDIGTGSGCIAIALASNLPQAKITAFDVSESALEVAVANAVLNNCKIDFRLHDISKHSSFEGMFDIMVSNPPYVEISEQRQMQHNVLDYEPELALYAPECDPLFFYRKILEFSGKHLVHQGFVYFEINERFGQEMQNLLQEYSFDEIRILKDLSGRERFAKGRKCG